MSKSLIAGLALFALAGCGDTGTQQEGAKVVIANPVSDQLKGLSPLYRHLGLRRSVVDSGLPCKKVDGGDYQQTYKNLAMWTAHCTDSGNWAIFIAPTGDVQVRRCEETKQLNLPQCRLNSAPAATEPNPKTR